jgi:3-hydroxyacyl-[acyl-carrier-protein] dehydratase
MNPLVTELIPHRPPFLFVDEIVSESPDGLVARRTWHAEEDFYRGHYPGFPITPGVLLCEAVFQTGALFLARIGGGGAVPGSAEPGGRRAGSGVAGGEASIAGPKGSGAVPLLAKISDVRFRSPVYPGENILIEVRKKEALGGFVMMSGTVKSGDRRVLSVDFAVAWKVP